MVNKRETPKQPRFLRAPSTRLRAGCSHPRLLFPGCGGLHPTESCPVSSPQRGSLHRAKRIHSGGLVPARPSPRLQDREAQPRAVVAVEDAMACGDVQVQVVCNFCRPQAPGGSQPNDPMFCPYGTGVCASQLPAGQVLHPSSSELDVTLDPPGQTLSEL